MINFNALKELKVKIGRLFTFSSTNNKKLKNSKSPNYGTQNVADTININNKPDDNEELPYVYIQGSFGGNGHVLDFRSCTTYNLSDKFVFIDKIEVLGATIPFENALIKSGESLQHTGINGLAYPSSDDP
ncbi:hypothetical protein KC992_04925, partial [Candidatus Saccharibacteria bacterium]|nr:hypothetical protein [Candidatus Saccharibacteria bacterium]